MVYIALTTIMQVVSSHLHLFQKIVAWITSLKRKLQKHVLKDFQSFSGMIGLSQAKHFKTKNIGSPK